LLRDFQVRFVCKFDAEEFTAYLNITKRLEFEERPDYVFLRGLFLGLLQKCELKYDLEFDWMLSKDK